MSAINGDKSRHQINRKRAVIHRAKIRQLRADVKARAAAPALAASAKPNATGKPNPTSDR